MNKLKSIPRKKKKAKSINYQVSEEKLSEIFQQHRIANPLPCGMELANQEVINDFFESTRLENITSTLMECLSCVCDMDQ